MKTPSAAPRIGIVADAFFYDSIRAAADFVYISPAAAAGDGADTILDGLDMVLAVSTWAGLENREWKGLAKPGSATREMLLALLARCRKRGIPTVFYSKEDPPHYGHFVCFAKLCCGVLTSAVESVPAYVRDCGHGNVAAMPFCFDPRSSNPLLAERTPRDAVRAVFAGSWMTKYPARCRALSMLLDGTVRAGLRPEIYDRNSGRADARKYRFPRRFARWVRPAVLHTDLAAVHAAAAWSLNVNTVTGSATMFAGRCVELAASGANVLSNYSFGMHRLLPEISIAYDERGAAELLRRATPQWTAFRAALGVRAAMAGFRCERATALILEMAGLRTPEQRPRPPAVAVIADGVDGASAAAQDLHPAFTAQTHPGFARELMTPARFAAAPAGRFAFAAFWDEDAARRGVIHPWWLQDALDCFAWADFAAVETAGGRVIKLESDGSPAKGPVHVMPPFALPDPLPDTTRFAFRKRRPLAALEIETGRDPRTLFATTLSSLLLCRTFRRLEISLLLPVDPPPTMAAAAEMAAHKYPNVTIRNVKDDAETENAGTEAAGATGLARIRLSAGDEVLPDGFDHFARLLSVPFAGRVSAAALHCSRTVVTERGAVAVRRRRFGIPLAARRPAFAFHCREENPPGEAWVPETPPKKRSPLARFLKCRAENGLLFTLARLILGKRRD